MANKKETNELSIKQENGVIPKNYADKIMDSINKFVSEKRLQLPQNYSVENALKSAWLKIIQIKGANECTPTSIANALLEMSIMGLNPAKSQCYFIKYGDNLQLFPSYFGKITALKRIEGVEEIHAQVIYEDDEITYDINTDGTISNIEHTQLFQNIKEDKIAGGYCVIKYNDEEIGTISTMEQIQEAWNKSTSAKKKVEFKSEFVKRTMINKAIKWFINTRDDEDLLIETINENENQYYDYEENNQEELPVEKTVVIESDIEENKIIIPERVCELEPIDNGQGEDSDPGINKFE